MNAGDVGWYATIGDRTVPQLTVIVLAPARCTAVHETDAGRPIPCFNAGHFTPPKVWPNGCTSVRNGSIAQLPVFIVAPTHHRSIVKQGTCVGDSVAEGHHCASTRNHRHVDGGGMDGVRGANAQRPPRIRTPALWQARGNLDASACETNFERRPNHIATQPWNQDGVNKAIAFVSVQNA